MAELYLAYRYEKEIEAAMKRVEELRKLQHEADIARSVQKVIIKRFAEITGMIPGSGKYYMSKDEKSILLEFHFYGVTILNYDRPGSCKKDHPARISVNPTKEEIDRIVANMIENYIKFSSETFNYWKQRYNCCNDTLDLFNSDLKYLAKKLGLSKIYLIDFLKELPYQIDWLLLACITSQFTSKIDENFVADLDKARSFISNKLNLTSSQFTVYIENGEYEKFISENPLEAKLRYKGFCFA